MAVFRVQKTQNYTIMSNHHLRNKALSLKAKGLLSLMLSLPEDWDYTTRGLASICKEGVDSVCATVRELEAAGYIIRRRIRDKNGQMRGMEYTVLEQPQPPEQDKPSCAQPKQAKPKREKPVQANPAQLNTKEQKKEITKNVSNPIRTADEREQYRDLIRENIEYDILAKNNPADRIRLDELVELMLDTVCSKRSSIRIAGDEFPTEVVKSRFLKLEAQHINHQQSGRDLMTPDEVRLLDNSKCILFIRGERPVVDYKYNLLKHPNIRYTEDGGAAPYDYTAADNARDDLPGAPENYELLDMDDFLPAEAAETKPTIQRIRRPK